MLDPEETKREDYADKEEFRIQEQWISGQKKIIFEGDYLRNVEFEEEAYSLREIRLDENFDEQNHFDERIEHHAGQPNERNLLEEQIDHHDDAPYEYELNYFYEQVEHHDDVQHRNDDYPQKLENFHPYLHLEMMQEEEN